MTQLHSRKHTPAKVGHLPLLLARLICAARQAGAHGPNSDVTAIIEVLRRAGALAERATSIRGAGLVSQQEIASEIEQLARAYLGLDHAQQAVCLALQKVEPVALRDRLAAVQSQVLEAQATAHFYAGLAFGVTMTDCH